MFTRIVECEDHAQEQFDGDINVTSELAKAQF